MANDGMETDHAGHHTHPEPGPAAGPLRERLGWEAFEYRIAPIANRLPYMLGGLTFFTITILIVTGLLLDQFYNPSPTAAHDSVLYIMTRVPLGNWVRALHYWAATVALISVVLHLVFVFWRRSYARPREVTWWAGVALYAVIFGLVFTGTVLRSDQEGVEALEHAMAGAKLAGPLGAPLAADFARSTSLLSRLHSVHVSLLPLVLLALIGVHFFLIRVHGIHAHEPKTVPFTHHIRKLTGYGLLLLALMGALAYVFPAEIGNPGVSGVEVTKPFWPFLWIYAAENTIGMVGMVIAPIVVFGFLAIVPFLDRNAAHDRPRSRVLVTLAWAVAALYIGGILYGVFAPQMQHLGM